MIFTKQKVLFMLFYLNMISFRNIIDATFLLSNYNFFYSDSLHLIV